MRKEQAATAAIEEVGHVGTKEKANIPLIVVGAIGAKEIHNILRETKPPERELMETKILISSNLRDKIEFVQDAQQESNRAEEMRNELKREVNQPIRQIGKWGAVVASFLGALYSAWTFLKPSKEQSKILEGLGKTS